MFSICDSNDKQLYSLPDGTFELARKQSIELAEIAGEAFL